MMMILYDDDDKTLFLGNHSIPVVTVGMKAMTMTMNVITTTTMITMISIITVISMIITITMIIMIISPYFLGTTSYQL